MDNLGTGILLLKDLLGSFKSNPQVSNREVRNIVQEELRKSNNSNETEFLREVLAAMEERDKIQKRQEEKNLQAKVEELSQKLDKFDKEKKAEENRRWVKEVLKKARASKGQETRTYQGGSRPTRSSNDPKVVDGYFPWTDGPKSDPNTFRYSGKTDSSFMGVNHDNVSFNAHGGGNRRSGPPGGFRRNYPPSNQEGHRQGGDGRDHRGQQHNPNRGNYRGRGRGAIPKNLGRSTDNIAGNVKTDDIDLLKAKLQNLSISDVQVSLLPEEIIAIKNALKEKKISAVQSKNTPKKKTNKKESCEQKEKVQEDNKLSSPKPPSEIKSAPAEPKKPKPQPPMPLQLYPVANFSDSVLLLLPEEQVLEDALLMAREGNTVISHQPRTIRELKELKEKHPTAELFSLKPPTS